MFRFLPILPGRIKPLQKLRLQKRLFWLVYMKGSVLVNRKNEQSRIKSFEMKSVLAAGMHMSILPGTHVTVPMNH